MLGYVWAGLIIVSVLSAILLGNTESLSTALIESGSSSIELLLTMAGILCLWSGIMKIAEESGFTALISKIFAPLLRPLFPKLDKVFSLPHIFLKYDLHKSMFLHTNHKPL